MPTIPSFFQTSYTVVNRLLGNADAFTRWSALVTSESVLTFIGLQQIRKTAEIHVVLVDPIRDELSVMAQFVKRIQLDRRDHWNKRAWPDNRHNLGDKETLIQALLFHAVVYVTLYWRSQSTVAVESTILQNSVAMLVADSQVPKPPLILVEDGIILAKLKHLAEHCKRNHSAGLRKEADSTYEVGFKTVDPHKDGFEPFVVADRNFDNGRFRQAFKAFLAPELDAQFTSSNAAGVALIKKGLAPGVYWEIRRGVQGISTSLRA